MSLVTLNENFAGGYNYFSHPGFERHPLFSEVGEASAAPNDLRASSLSLADGRVLKQKGTNMPLLIGVSSRAIMQRIDGGEIPGGLAFTHGLKELNNTNRVRQLVSQTSDIPVAAHTPIAVEPLDQVFEVNGLDYDDFIYVHKARVEDILRQEQLPSGVIHAYLSALDQIISNPETKPAVYTAELPSKDIRANQLPSMLAFEQDLYLLGDPYFRLDAATRSKKPGNIGGYFNGPATVKAAGSYDNLLKSVYGLIQQDYSIEVGLPDYEITSENYLAELAKLRSYTDVGAHVMEVFCTHIANTIAIVHAHYLTFGSNKKGTGGALISRNVGVGTSEQGVINDLMTVKEATALELQLLIQKDLREVSTSIVGVSRLWNREVSSIAWQKFKSAYKSKLYHLDRKVYLIAYSALRSNQVQEMLDFLEVVSES